MLLRPLSVSSHQNLRRVLRAAVFILGLCAFGISDAAKSRDCTKREKAAANKLLKLSASNQKLFLERHLPWGAPQTTSTTESILVHRDYVIAHDNELRIPIWTAHRLDAKGLGKSGRVDCFRQDPRIGTQEASIPADYVEPVYDQGHLSPNGDMTRALYPVINSFVMSNMAPQFCQFNRGTWQIFESILRLWVQERKTIYVISGSILDRDGDGKRDPNSAAKRMRSDNKKERVAIPSHFYKIVLHQDKQGAVEAIAVLLQHEQIRSDVKGDDAVKYLTDSIVSIAEIEKVTGMTFFPRMTGQGAAIKQARATKLWPYKGKPSNSLVFDTCRKTKGKDD